MASQPLYVTCDPMGNRSPESSRPTSQLPPSEFLDLLESPLLFNLRQSRTIPIWTLNREIEKVRDSG